MVITHTLIAKLFLALLIGGIVGTERELRSKSAGFRTLILICLGATLFTIFSIFIGHNGTPDRIASNIVVGIGFIGAGVIFKSDNRVNGITTAATIWLTAALGVGIGCGYYIAAIIGCIMVVSVLFLFSFLDAFIDKINQVRDYTIVYHYHEHSQHQYDKLFTEFRLKVNASRKSKTGDKIKGVWNVKGMEKNHHAFIEYILKDKSVTDFDF